MNGNGNHLRQRDKIARNAYIAIATAVIIVILGCAVALIAPSKATARDVEPEWTWRVPPSDITNCKALREMRLEKLKSKLDAAVEEWRAEKEAEEQAALEAEAAYWDYSVPDTTYYSSGITYYGVQGDPDGLNSFVGVVDGPNGTTETAYSSNVLYHYRTNEWTPDEYGFYRTEDGYYVVASNEYEEGTVIETSRGEAMVLDGGCDAGYIDFYTNW